MLRSLLSLSVVVSLLGVTSARAQSVPATPAPADGWAAPATSASEATYERTGSSAAGGGSGLIDRPSTDYWGRPLGQKYVVTRRVSVRGVADFNDLAMRNEGMMLAPGLNTAPYRGVSTDYWGQPLRNPASVGAVVKAKAFAAVVPYVGQP